MAPSPAITEPESALPSVRARIIAFVSILAAGALGGATGVWFMGTQCDDGCTVGTGLSMWFGTVLLSLGAAVVAVISLRTVAEWNSGRRA
ncbi:MAG: hypothetical protein GX868_01045 [Actinobacteria bacterium]|nr:hypothetical protein [Actinomycetota bacterium]